MITLCDLNVLVTLFIKQHYIYVYRHKITEGILWKYDKELKQQSPHIDLSEIDTC